MFLEITVCSQLVQFSFVRSRSISLSIFVCLCILYKRTHSHSIYFFSLFSIDIVQCKIFLYHFTKVSFIFLSSLHSFFATIYLFRCRQCIRLVFVPDGIEYLILYVCVLLNSTTISPKKTEKNKEWSEKSKHSNELRKLLVFVSTERLHFNSNA